MVRRRSARRKQPRTNKKPFYDWIVIFAIFISMGFPGSYLTFLPESMGTIAEYSAFLLEIAAMILSSSDRLLDCNLIHLRRKYLPIYGFAVYIFATSMLVTNYPKWQLISCIRYIVTIIFALWLIDRYEFEELLTIIVKAQILIVLSSLMLVVIAPNVAFSSVVNERDFVGLYTTKNACAYELSLGIIMQLNLYWTRKDKHKAVSLWFILILVVQIMMLVLCNCTGALLFAVIVLMYGMLYEYTGHRRLPIGTIFVSISVLFIVFTATILPWMEPIFVALGKDVTLTGRTVLWNKVIEVMMQAKTFLGYGLEMFWRDQSGVDLFHAGFTDNVFASEMTSGAHNLLLEMWLNIGLMGVAMFLLMILLCTNRITKISRAHYRFCSMLMFYFLLKGLTERIGGTFNYNILFVYMTLGVACCKQVSGKQNGKEKRKDYVTQRNSTSTDTAEPVSTTGRIPVI